MTDAERARAVLARAEAILADTRQRAMPTAEDVRWLCAEIGWFAARADAAEAALRDGLLDHGVDLEAVRLAVAEECATICQKWEARHSRQEILKRLAAPAQTTEDTAR